MSVKLIPDTFNPTLYNLTTIHPLQSWEWGEARKQTGLKIIRFGEFDGEDLKHSYLMTLHNIPMTNLKIGYIPRSVIPSNEVTDFLKDISHTQKILFIKFEPYVPKSETRSTKFDSSLEVRLVPRSLSNEVGRTKWETNTKSKIIKSPHPLFTQWTIIMDISKSEKILLENLKSKTRYNIKLAQKKGVYVKEESNEKGYKIFEKLYFETIKRQNYLGHDKNYHNIIWENLKNKISHILIAYYKNEPLSAYQLFLYKNKGYYVYGGSSDKHRNLMASNLLMWESLIFCKNKNCTEFDMWGSLGKNYSQTDSYAGFTRFKEGYGGEFIQMIGSYDLVLKPFIYRIYNLLYSLRKKFLKI
jgi:lipid II:glycine glycyltransferase (peptidoglycan interpeptide bridge formation enzyme)